MQRKLQIIILLFLFPLTLIGQNNTSWYRHYNMDSMEFIFPSGLEPCGNDAVLVIAATTPANNPPSNRSSLVRLDGENGDIIWSTRLVHNHIAEESGIFYFIRGVIRLRDGSYIILVHTTTEDGDDGFALHRIASNGSIIWRQDYGIPGQNILPNAGGLGISPDSMSFAVSARRTDLQNPSSSLLLYHIDEDGVVVKNLILGTGLEYYWTVSPVAMLVDSSFVVALNLGSIDLSAPKWLWRISYNGQSLSTHIAWDFGWWSDLRRHPNGQLIAVSQSFSGEWENRETHGLRTTLYTPELDTVWSRVYNHFEGPLYYTEIDFPGGASFDAQGNILVSGDGSAYNGVRPAHLIMYDIVGEIEWIKRIGIQPDLAGHVHSIGGKVAFQPNGILLAGTIGINEMLLIKLDSAGCIGETECGMDYLLDLHDEPEMIVLDVRLVPNPVRDEVTISIPQDQFQLLTMPKIHFWDMLGHLHSSFTLSISEQKFDIGSLPEGIYIVTIESTGNVLQSQKLVKW